MRYKAEWPTSLVCMSKPLITVITAIKKDRCLPSLRCSVDRNRGECTKFKVTLQFEVLQVEESGWGKYAQITDIKRSVFFLSDSSLYRSKSWPRVAVRAGSNRSCYQPTRVRYLAVFHNIPSFYFIFYSSLLYDLHWNPNILSKSREWY